VWQVDADDAHGAVAHANEALSMARQSCPTVRLRGATRIQNRKLWREYGRRLLVCGS
jgi:hypothetical protein